ncbi:MAG: Rpn family recombination-promoting nuclease/putative transposase [Polyangiaceae bacterium]|nr:Rpn family recombination-promoting nuclease/putative transposase [Polyangiaceae bacterium]
MTLAAGERTVRLDTLYASEAAGGGEGRGDGGCATDPHDKLFREAMSNPKDAAALLRAPLPAELAAELDLEELQAVPGTFLDEELRRAQSDVLLKTRYRGGDADVWVLFEHKCGADRWTVLQVLRYMVRTDATAGERAQEAAGCSSTLSLKHLRGH